MLRQLPLECITETSLPLMSSIVIGYFWNVYSQSTNPPQNTCLEDRVQVAEDRVQVLEDALTNLYQKFNDLVNTLNNNQKTISDCLKQNFICKNTGGNDVQDFGKIQPPQVLNNSRTEFADRQNLPEDVQCANEVLVEHKVEQIRTEMSELMVSYNFQQVVTSLIISAKCQIMYKCTVIGIIPPNHLLLEPWYYHGDGSKITLLPLPWQWQ